MVRKLTFLTSYGSVISGYSSLACLHFDFDVTLVPGPGLGFISPQSASLVKLKLAVELG